MSCPWAKIEKPEPVNLNDIMSEEYAKELQAKEERKYIESIVDTYDVLEDAKDEIACGYDCDTAASLESSETVCDSDAEIAKMLQLQFDKEHDLMLKRTQDKYNGTSKVSISFDNFRRSTVNDDFESDSEEEEIEDIRDRRDWDRFDTLKRQMHSIPACGYKVQQDGSVITKHDVVLSGRKNACKMLLFPPEFQTGDGEYFDMKLSNKVFNSLKIFSQHEEAKHHKLHDKKEDRATVLSGLDLPTTLILYKMVNKQLLDGIDKVISTGKEAIILHADGCPNYTMATVPKECAIKVFKTTLSEYKQRDKYIKDDHRFKDRIGKQTAKQTVRIWAEKEMANLYRLRRAGILCPEVVELKKHVLVMSFIGDNREAACKLKNARMKDSDYIQAYSEVVQAMKTMYDKANLIHSDLSEYNILWHNKRCYFIDVSQAVEPSHINALYFLKRDCDNITNFFNRKSVEGVIPSEDLFRSITGCDYDDKVALAALESSLKIKPHLVDKPDYECAYNFDDAWERSNINRADKLIDAKEGLIVEAPLA